MNYEDLVRNIVEQNQGYHQALDIVRNNSSGRIWLIGGFIYRGLARELYGTPFCVKDYDFIVDEERTHNLPEGITLERNSFGNPKLIAPEFKIDMVALSKIKFPPLPETPNSIEYFLQGNPFTVQALAYDVDARNLIGEVGQQAIAERMVRVNCWPEAQSLSILRKKSIEELLRTLAESLNFGYQL